MTDVFYLRPLDPPATPEAVQEGSAALDGCFNLHKVDWHLSFLAEDGGRMLCWYRAPDAESARLALRELGSDMSAVWPGSVIGGQALGDSGVLAEIPAKDPFPDVAELAGRLQGSGQDEAAFAVGFVSNRRDRLVCLFRGSDAQAADSNLRRAGLRAERLWPCAVVRPGSAGT